MHTSLPFSASLTLYAFFSVSHANEPVNSSDKIVSMTIKSQSELTWFPLNPQMPEMGKFAVLSGNPQTGPSTILMSFNPVPQGVPAGGLHKHSNGYTSVVLAGTPKHGPSPEEAVSFSAGGYWNQPGEEAHYDICVGSEPCVILTYWTDVRDFFPAEQRDDTVAWKGVLPDQVVWEKGAKKKSQIAIASGDPQSGPSVRFTQYAAGYKSKSTSNMADSTTILISGDFQYGTDSLSAVNPGDIIIQPSNQVYLERCKDDCLLVTVSHGL